MASSLANLREELYRAGQSPRAERAGGSWSGMALAVVAIAVCGAVAYHTTAGFAPNAADPDEEHADPLFQPF